MKVRAVLIATLAATFAASSAHAAQKDGAAGWYPIAQKAAALEQAKKLGRPIAVLWYADTQKAGPPGQWIDQWKKSDLPKQFVCIISESKIENQNISLDPLVMKLLQANGINLQRLSPPYLLLGSARGGGYGSLYSGSTLADALKTIQAALQKHGGGVVQKPPPAQPAPDNKARPAPPAPDNKARPALPADVNAALKQKLNEARRLWKAGKHEEALARYRDLAAARKTNPNLPVMAELRKDAETINHRAMAELNRAAAAANNGRLDEAAKETERIAAAYKGFAVAQQAKQLLAQIHAAQKQRAVARPGPNPNAPQPPKNNGKPPAVLGQPQKPPAPPARKAPARPPIRIPRIKSWYESDEKAQALKAARFLGRPVALAWHLEGRSKGKLRKWKASNLAKHCVGLTVTSTLNNGTYGLDDELLQRVFMASGLDLGKTPPPCVLVCTIGGQFLGIVQANADTADINRVLREVAKKYGKTLTARQAFTAWKKLDTARKLWSAGKHAAALNYYREVAALEKLNPALPIVDELHKDTGAIALRGARELEAAEMLLAADKFDEAAAQVRKIYRAYKGFDTAKDAKELFKKVKAAQKNRALADKAIEQIDDKIEDKKPPKKDDKTKPDYNDDF